MTANIDKKPLLTKQELDDLIERMNSDQNNDICKYIEDLVKNAYKYACTLAAKESSISDDPKLAVKKDIINKCNFYINSKSKNKPFWETVECIFKDAKFQNDWEKESIDSNGEKSITYAKKSIILKAYCLQGNSEEEVRQIYHYLVEKIEPPVNENLVFDVSLVYSGKKYKYAGLGQLILLSMIINDKAYGEDEIFQRARVIDKKLKTLDPPPYTIHKTDLRDFILEYKSKNTKFNITSNTSLRDNNSSLTSLTKDKWKPSVNERCSNLRILGVTTHQRDIMNIYEWWFPILFSGKDSNKIIKVSNKSRIIKLIDKLFNENQRKMLVFGKQGFGKTSLLKLIAMKCCDGKFQSDCLPIFISMRRIFEKDNSSDSSSYLRESIETLLAKKSINPQDFNQIISEGKVLFLFDAIDVNNQALTAVKEFVHEFSNNAFIFTSSQDLVLDSTFSKFEILGFDQTSSEKFVEMWFTSKSLKNNEQDKNIKPDLAKKLNKKISSDYFEQVSGSPLILQFLCLAEHDNNSSNDRYDQTPYLVAEAKKGTDTSNIDSHNQLILYKNALFGLVRDNDDEHRFDPDDEVYERFSESERINLLAYIAFKMIESQRSFVKIQTLAEYVREYLINTNNRLKDKSLSAEATIRSIEIQDGLLENKLWGDFAFSHSTIHEFFASWYISQNQSKWKDWKYLGLHVRDNKWKQVFKQAEHILSVNLEEFKDDFKI